MGGWRDDVKGGESLLRDEIVDCWTVFFCVGGFFKNVGRFVS